MILFVLLFGVLAAALAAEAARMTAQRKTARARAQTLAKQLRAATTPPPPVTVRVFECRREHMGLLWFLTLTVHEETREVARVASGLPHCPQCVAPLKLTASGKAEEWVCVGCDARHAGAKADLWATDALLTDCLREFFCRHPDFSPAVGLSAPKFEPSPEPRVDAPAMTWRTLEPAA